MRRFFSFARFFDWWILGAAVLLTAFGTAVIYSVALSQSSGDAAGPDLRFVWKQALAFGLGLFLCFVFAATHDHFFRSWTLGFYVAAVALLAGVLLWGNTARGTTGWFTMQGFSFQPVELAKFAILLILAKYLANIHPRRIAWTDILRSGLWVALPLFFTLRQPDFGSAFLLLLLWVFFLFLGGISWRQVLPVFLVFLVAASFAWFSLFADYQRERIWTFLHPSSDPLDAGYHVTQAVIAVGSGGLMGQGLGFGSQSQLQFLPESQTDFVFAVIAEELGFVGVMLILSTFGILFWRLLWRWKRTRDPYRGFLLLGITGLFFFPTVLNIGMNMKLVPVTGVGLPFVSYGGSNLLLSFALIGLAQSIALRTRTPFPSENSFVE